MMISTQLGGSRTAVHFLGKAPGVIKLVHVEDDRSFQRYLRLSAEVQIEQNPDFFSGDTLKIYTLNSVDAVRPFIPDANIVITDSNLIYDDDRQGQQVVDMAKAHNIPVGVWASTPTDLQNADRYFEKMDGTSTEKILMWIRDLFRPENGSETNA